MIALIVIGIALVGLGCYLIGTDTRPGSRPLATVVAFIGAVLVLGAVLGVPS